MTVDKYISSTGLALAKESLGSVQFAMYFQKNSYFTNIFNKNIQKLMESGFIAKWFAILNTKGSQGENSETTIESKQIFGILWICGAGYILSILVFFGEIIKYYKCVK